MAKSFVFKFLIPIKIFSISQNLQQSLVLKSTILSIIGNSEGRMLYFKRITVSELFNEIKSFKSKINLLKYTPKSLNQNKKK